MATDTLFDLKDKLVTDFEGIHGNSNGNTSDYWSTLRKDALATFKASSFPTRKDEEWKYTSVKEITDKDFGLVESPLLNQVIDLSPYMIEGVEPIVLTFINGQLSTKNSSLIEKQSGIELKNLSSAMQENHPVLKQYYGKIASDKENAFSALSTAYCQDGTFLHLTDNTALQTPIVIVHLSDASAANQASHQRNLFVLGQNAQAKIIEVFHSKQAENFSLTNSLTEIYAAQDALLDYYKIQQEDNEKNYQINNTKVQQEKGSKVYVNTFSFGGKLIRNQLDYLHLGEHIESFLNGVYLTNENQLVDNHSLVDHAQPNCMSDEFYKGIMGGKSKAVFNGKIMVRQDAQKTNAFQTNRNVLVSDTANVYTKPQLEIFADDVKCSHGCTIGQLDDQALFYMQARGIGKETARKLLLMSFAAEVVERVQYEPMKAHLNGLIEAKIAQM